MSGMQLIDCRLVGNYQWDNQISVVQRSSVEVDKNVMVSEFGDLSILVEL